jgi:hypothetical protein
LNQSCSIKLKNEASSRYFAGVTNSFAGVIISVPFAVNYVIHLWLFIKKYYLLNRATPSGVRFAKNCI